MPSHASKSTERNTGQGGQHPWKASFNKEVLKPPRRKVDLFPEAVKQIRRQGSHLFLVQQVFPYSAQSSALKPFSQKQVREPNQAFRCHRWPFSHNWPSANIPHIRSKAYPEKFPKAVIQCELAGNESRLKLPHREPKLNRIGREHKATFLTSH